MKKNKSKYGPPPPQSTVKYRSKNRPWTRGLTYSCKWINLKSNLQSTLNYQDGLAIKQKTRRSFFSDKFTHFWEKNYKVILYDPLTRSPETPAFWTKKVFFSHNKHYHVAHRVFVTFTYLKTNSSVKSCYMNAIIRHNRVFNTRCFFE